MRNKDVDIVKGIGIILVIIGHVSYSGLLIKYIYAFHMPLFFIASGHFTKIDSYSTYFSKKFKSILIPFYSFFILTYLYWLFIERTLRSSSQNVEWWQPIIGLLYGTNLNNTAMINNTPLWFLPCLFSTSIVFLVLTKEVKYIVLQIFITITIFLFGVNFISSISLRELPYGFGIACIGLPFYMLGNFYYKKLVFLMSVDLKSRFIILIANIVVFVVSVNNNTNVNLMGGQVGNIFLFLLSSLSGILTTYILVSFIKNARVLEFFGKNSLIIFALHGPITRIVIYVISYLTKSKIEIIRENMLYTLVITLITLLILSPLIYLINKKTPWIIGRY